MNALKDSNCGAFSYNTDDKNCHLYPLSIDGINWNDDGSVDTEDRCFAKNYLGLPNTRIYLGCSDSPP